MDKTAIDLIECVCDEMCNDYCKWPDEWDPDEHDGVDLCDSYVCDNCPLNKLR